MDLVIILISVLFGFTLIALFSKKKSKIRKASKYVWVSISVIVFLLIGLFKWTSDWSPGARKAQQNVENSLKLTVGMSIGEMIKIMGPPEDSVLSSSPEEPIIYYYSPPSTASSGIDIEIKNDTIYRINYYE